MARPATKKVAKKTPQKNQQRSTKTSSVIDKVEQSLKSAQAEFERHQDSLRSARITLKARRADALKKGTRASQALVDRAYTAVAKATVSVDKSHRQASVAKAKVRVAKILQQVESAEVNAEEKILAVEARLARQAEEHLKSAIEKYEARWRKRRAVADARKLKLAKKSASSKVKSTAKKAQMEIKAVERKAAKSLMKPLKAPARPGRPGGRPKKVAVVPAGVAKAAPKKRGRPAKPKPASPAGTAPAKRGRPPKARPVSAGTATARAAAQAPKRRGRPPKAK